MARTQRYDTAERDATDGATRGGWVARFADNAHAARQTPTADLWDRIRADKALVQRNARGGR